MWRLRLASGAERVATHHRNGGLGLPADPRIAAERMTAIGAERKLGGDIGSFRFAPEIDLRSTAFGLLHPVP